MDESLWKHEKKEALAMRWRSQCWNSMQGCATSAETKLFGSNPQWRDGDDTATDKYKIKDEAAMRCLRLLTRDNTPDVPSAPLIAASEMPLTGSPSLSITASAAPDRDALILMPEYVSLWEERRRNEAAALKALEAKLAEIKEEEGPQQFKPLNNWKKPTFDFPSLDSTSRSSRKHHSEISSSSAASMGKKRKASNEPTTNSCGLETQVSLSASKKLSLPGISTSSASYYPIADKFFNKWFTPDMDKRRKRSE